MITITNVLLLYLFGIGVGIYIGATLHKIFTLRDEKVGGRFFVRKTSRVGLPLAPELFVSKREAKKKADKLTKKNPVGYEVVDLLEEANLLANMYRKALSGEDPLLTPTYNFESEGSGVGS